MKVSIPWDESTKVFPRLLFHCLRVFVSCVLVINGFSLQSERQVDSLCYRWLLLIKMRTDDFKTRRGESSQKDELREEGWLV